MSLGYILSQVSRKMGMDQSESAQRTVMLSLVNEACRELYAQCDMAGSLMEAAFKVNGDQTVTLPSYVGKIRAVRELASMQVWHINQMRPRYNQFNWPDMWRNYRLKNKQALMASVVNQSVGVITVNSVETPPIVVTVSGPTKYASLIHESILMDTVSKQTVNPFLDYTSVKKDRTNDVDVTLSDVDGRVLTVIPNNEKVAEYQVIDISSCPWLPNNTSKLDNYVEILYKQKLALMVNDGDEFPGFDYDDVIVNKIMQLWNEEQSKADVAAAYDAKATRSTARLHEDQNRETEDMVALVANPHDSVLKRIGSGIRRRYSLYAGRKY